MSEKTLSSELRAGIDAASDLTGIVLQGQATWDAENGWWILPVSITADVASDEPIPATTRWYLLIDDAYPYGKFRVNPAKDGGITLTFPHQNCNTPDPRNTPWRRGNICTSTNAVALGRRGYDTEPADPDKKLSWHLRRAREWIKLASQDALVYDGDWYELPDVPWQGNDRLAFSEGSESFVQWQQTSARYGTAETGVLEAASSPIIVKRFLPGKGRLPITQEWLKDIASPDGAPLAWLRLDQEPVLTPWQIPLSWGEFRKACQNQCINLDALLRELTGNFTGDRNILLIGFPIPGRVGQPDVRMHWFALKVPTAITEQQRGFRANEAGQWQEYKTNQIHDAVPLRWIKTENWQHNEVTGRGRLSADLTRHNLLIIGAGALGSAIAEMLVRAGLINLTVMDKDQLEVGNLVRHTLLSTEIGANKAGALAARLNAASISAKVMPMSTKFPPEDAIDIATIQGCSTILDCTGDDATARHLSIFPWGNAKTFISLSVGIHARRLFCFTAQGDAFPFDQFMDKLQPWLDDESEAFDIDLFPREGIGCFHPLHPARIDDLWMMSASAVRLIEQAIASPPGTPSLTVLEQQTDETGNFGGISDVSARLPGSAGHI